MTAPGLFTLVGAAVIAETLVAQALPPGVASRAVQEWFPTIVTVGTVLWRLEKRLTIVETKLDNLAKRE